MALFPHFDVGAPGASPNGHFISNAVDCTKLREVLGLAVTPADVTIKDTAGPAWRAVAATLVPPVYPSLDDCATQNSGGWGARE